MKNRNLNNNDNWATPKYLYDELDSEFHFDFDPCPLNHDTEKWNGLEVEWGGCSFVNPPYSKALKDKFIEKAHSEWQKGKTVVMLLPNSTGTIAFHKFIYGNAELRFIKGRVSFLGINTKGEYVTNKKGMHDSMIVIFK